MVQTIDMQAMRHLNLFERVTRISTRFCFPYNDAIYFCVPKELIPQALGKNAENLRRISETIGRKIRVIPKPAGIYHAKEFIKTIVSPVEFQDFEIRDNEMILTAGKQSKAALIGRNRRRLNEMQKIVKDFFGMDFRIV